MFSDRHPVKLISDSLLYHDDLFEEAEAAQDGVIYNKTEDTNPEILLDKEQQLRDRSLDRPMSKSNESTADKVTSNEHFHNNEPTADTGTSAVLADKAMKRLSIARSGAMKGLVRSNRLKPARDLTQKSQIASSSAIDPVD